MTEGVKKTCPKCGKKKLRRLIGAGGAIMFKGSGFYNTDYRSESYKKGAAADSGNGGKKSDGKGSDSTGAGSSSSGGGEG
jgi:predicted nucleic acid-binding Zn ribbon protein